MTRPDVISPKEEVSTSPSIVERSSRADVRDLNVVDLDPVDPEHPYNWPPWRTRLNLTLISCMTFLTPLASSIFAPGIPQLTKEFHSSSPVIASFVVSIYLLGFAAGPLVLAPLSELYGRLPVYHVSNAGFIAFTVGCALAPNINTLIGFRLVAGLFGSCPITIGAGSINDMVPPEKRTTAIAFFAIGPLLGPVVGPVAALVAMSETYHPILLRRKVMLMRKATKNDQLQSRFDIDFQTTALVKRNLVRLFKMLASSPVMIILALYIAVTYGYLYLMFTTITPVFQTTYHFSTSIVGLAFLGLGVGSVLGIVVYATAAGYYVKYHAHARHDEPLKPEHRLISLPLGAILLPAGLFLYGWTAQYEIHWIVPIIGMGITGIGSIVIFMGILSYLIDAYTIYSASAIAANSIVRSIASAVLPLAGLPLYQNLGVGWGNSVLGFIAVAFIPVSFLVLKHGGYLRQRFEVKDL
ncbi:major facilitator superfamily domain-containing protein [Nemania sp. FL0031]|nr:major facilitator superfamily domain-containing protein [Nemania sp. FL0031]